MSFGAVSILAGLLFAAFGAVVCFARRDGLKLGVYAAIGFFAAMLAANLYMVNGLVNFDFSIGYVAQVGSRATPLVFRIVSLWSALEGSILFWGLILGSYTLAFALSYRNEKALFIQYALGTLLAVGVFFAFLIAGPASPFHVLNPAPSDGPGPNPLLQNHILMVIHPPILYLGYVGMTVPFAVAVGALVSGEISEKWMAPLRRWTMLGWIFLSCGILIGGRWAYAVLGWGGYWAWDPVENASFLPWLTATAFIHGTIVQERRHMLKAWTLSLALLTFILVILGTFMTRSGVFNSVHAFTQSDIGPTFLVFIGVLLLVSVVLLALRSHLLVSDGRIESLASRDTAFFVNNLLFVALTFTVLIGTLYPLIAEAVRGVKVSVGEPYYNKMSVPMGVAILFLMGVGPALPWGRATQKTVRNLLVPVGAALLTVVLCMAAGLRAPWSLITFALAAFTFVVTTREIMLPVLVRSREKKESFFAAMIDVSSKAQRRMGGYVVHTGIIAIFVAIAASQSYVTHTQGTLKEGEVLQVGAYAVKFDTLEQGSEPHRKFTAAKLSVQHGGDNFTLEPRVNYYPRSTDPVGSPALYGTASGDLYLSLLAYDKEAKTATLNAWFFPLVGWIWYSMPLLILGSMISLWPMRRRQKAAEPAAEPAVS